MRPDLYMGVNVGVSRGPAGPPLLTGAGIWSGCAPGEGVTNDAEVCNAGVSLSFSANMSCKQN